MSDTPPTDESQVSPKDFGTDPAGVAGRWISELGAAIKDRADWLKDAKRIVRKYRRADSSNSANRRFSLLWSNMETLAPAVFARAPTAVVGRRWKDGDDVARIASEVLERTLNFFLETGDFFGRLKGARDEFLLTARGVSWVRYVPHTSEDGEDEEGNPQAKVDWEEVVFDHVCFPDFLHNPARNWSEVRWVARITYQTRDELIARFGKEVGAAIPLDHKPDKDGQSDEDDQFSKAAIYEIWDLPSRTALWISKSYNTAPLDQQDDPLRLKDFFPCPRPAYGTLSPDSLMPVPDYLYYESQARDIDELTRRIGRLTEAAKLRGFYSAGGEQKDKLKDILAGDDGTLIPIEAWVAFGESGGAKNLIQWLPLDMIVETLKGLVEARQQLIADVYQLTGIADIMRGDVDPEETATATKIKGNWGALRVRDKQKELARFIRDQLRIGAEIVATQFSPEVLAQISAVKLFQTAEEKQQAQAQLQAQAQQAQQMAQAAQQQGLPAPPPFQPPPDVAEMLGRPTWEDVMGILKNNTLRGFRIDVETDSTIEPNDQEEKQRRIEFVTAVGEYIAKSLPAIQLMPPMTPVITQGLLFLVRGFRVGREMEETIEEALGKLENAPPPPQQQGAPQKPGELPQAQMANAQASQMKGQAAMMDAQTRRFEAVQGVKLEGARIQAENQRSNMDRQAEVQMHGADVAADLQQAVVKGVERRMVHDMNSPKPIEAPTR